MKIVSSEIKTLFLLLYFGECLLLNVQGKFERILSFKSCKYDDDCIQNSFCYRNSTGAGECRCKEDYVLVYDKTSYQCLEVAKGIGSDCVVNIQCEINLGALADCDLNENKCKCIDGSHFGKDKMCHKTIELGGICQTNDNCLLSDGSYGYCYIGKCTCNSDQHISEDKKRCIRSIYLEETCELTDSCTPEFSACDNHICKCIQGYIEGDDNKTCLKVASTVGDNCTQTIQCSEYIKGAFCDNNICTCKSDHHGYGNECVINAKLGERCSADKECIINADLEKSVKCSDGICACVVGVSNEDGYGCILNNSANNLKLQSWVGSILVFIIILVINK